MGRRIVFVGAGALGGYVDGHLTRAGHNITFIDPWPEHVEYLRKNGIQLSGKTPAEKHTVFRVGEPHGRVTKRVEEIAEMLRAVEGAKTRSDDQRPSMAQDIAKGRRTETDYINDFIAARGTEIRVPAPTHTKMHDVVKRVERGELKQGPAVIEGFQTFNQRRTAHRSILTNVRML